MKKIALSALLAATLVSATDFNYEITPVAGYCGIQLQMKTQLTTQVLWVAFKTMLFMVLNCKQMSSIFWDQTRTFSSLWS